MKVIICVLLFGIISCVSALNVSQCHDIENPIPGLNERVRVGNCRKPPCRLRKNTSIKIQLKITPDSDVESLVNNIQAFIAGVPFPFPGVDQTDACQFIYSADGKDKVGCPLKKGEDYIYRNNIEVLQIYPRLKIIVHWAVTPPKGQDVICFEIPARITN